MTIWKLCEPARVPIELQAAVGGHPLVAQTLVRRGISTPEQAQAFLNAYAYTPSPAESLPGIPQAVDYLERAVRAGEAIWVWGDFDVDGQTSTAVLVSTLRDLGASVHYHIPVRGPESHGVGLTVLEQVIEQGAKLILTCDTGITASEAVEFAHQRGVKVVITDHHALPAELPAAEAVVTPRLLTADHPLSSLPGVGVAYKLAEALYACFGRSKEVERHLDLVALGIVADVAGLRGDTRYLLQRGLDALRQTERSGLQVMMEKADILPDQLREEHIGFGLGPRLNALGRLGDANPAVELLTTTDLGRARMLASELEGLNARRRMLTEQVYQAAQEMIAREPNLAERPSLILSHQAWPAGVIGIVASRLVDRYQKPVILFAASPGEVAHGSARSVEGVDITAAIASQQGLLHSFGGHPMAAGLAIDAQNLPEFQRGLNRAILGQVGEGLQEPVLKIDGRLPLHELTLEMVADLERLAPFGQDNPSLVMLAENLQVQAITPVGRTGEHLQVRLQEPSGESFSAMWWQGAGIEQPEGQIDLVYTARTANYRGQRTVSIEYLASRPAKSAEISISRRKRELVIRDCRLERDPLRVLSELVEKGAQVWREGEAVHQVKGVDRNNLVEAETLVIWTVPPGLVELQAAVKRVKAREVILFAHEPGLRKLGGFVKQLRAMAQYSWRAYEGEMDIDRVAAVSGQRVNLVWAGLDWLSTKGEITVYPSGGGKASLQPAGIANTGEQQRAEQRLRAIWEDTQAFRAYFKEVRADILFGKDLEGL